MSNLLKRKSYNVPFYIPLHVVSTIAIALAVSVPATFIILVLVAVFACVCRCNCASSRNPHTTVTTPTQAAFTTSAVITTSSQQDGSKFYPDAGTDVKPASGYEMSTYPPQTEKAYLPPSHPYPPQQA